MSGLLALAFTAGMVAPVNPCGFALLPAWVTLQLDGDSRSASATARLARALRSGVALAIGFAGTLFVVGLIASAGARAIISAAPWLGIVTGLVLVVLGIAMLAGLRIGLPHLPGLRANTNGTGFGHSVTYGVGFAAASLSCTFGILLAVIAQAQATTTFTGMLAVFTVYAAGAATVLITVAAAAAIAGTAIQRHLATLAGQMHRVVAVILITTGGYLAWYWYPAALGETPNANRLATLAGALAGWVEGHATWVASGAAAIAIAVAGSAALSRTRTRHRRN